jgi:hypothetical protein
MSENRKRRNNLGSLAVDDRIILKWISEEKDVIAWTAFNWFRIWSSGGICVDGNKLSD